MKWWHENICDLIKCRFKSDTDDALIKKMYYIKTATCTYISSYVMCVLYEVFMPLLPPSHTNIQTFTVLTSQRVLAGRSQGYYSRLSV